MKTNGLDFVVSPTLCFKVYITSFSSSGSYDCYPNFSSVHFNKDIVSLFSDSLEIEFFNFLKNSASGWGIYNRSSPLSGFVGGREYG